MYAALDEDDDATTATGGNTTTLSAAAIMTGSTLTGAHTTAVPESIANAINQLSTNQTTMMSQISQIAAMSIAQRPQAPSFQTMHAPPLQQIAIPAIQPFSGAATGFQAGRTAGGGRGGRTGAKDVVDEDAGVDDMTVRHLPPTNRAKDAESAG